MAFSSSDSPEGRLGAGDGALGGPAAARSAGRVLRAADGEGEGGKGVLTEGRRRHSASTGLSVGVGRWVGVKGNLVELGKDWVSSVNDTKVLG